MMKTTDKPIKISLVKKNTVLSPSRGACRIRENNQASAKQVSKRASVTSPVLFKKVCFMAKYLSPLIRARWIRDVSHRTFVKKSETFCNVHV